MPPFLKINGANGEGGGQILRSSLALAMATGQSVHLTQIRAGRPKPGLMRQHLACVLAAQKVCGAAVEGAAIGSTELRFTPGQIQAGDYAFAIGSAGSTLLVLQTVLPALMLAKAPSTVTVEGGTHNPQAPPFEHFARAFLPQVEKMGPKFTAALERHGFCPAGGGKVTVAVAPQARLSGLTLLERGALLAAKARVLLAGGLREGIADKQLALVAKDTGWEAAQLTSEVVESIGPGNALVLEVAHEHITEVFSSLGSFERPSAQVVHGATRPLLKYLASDVAVAEHLTDQLMLPMALAAMQGQKSAFRTRGLTPHATTHVDLIRQFLPVKIQVVQEAPKSVRVEIG